jgi:hypothetical protein
MLLEQRTTNPNQSTSLAARTPDDRLVRRKGAGHAGAPPQPRPDAAPPSARTHRRPPRKRGTLPVGAIAVGIAVVLFAGHALYGRLSGPRVNGAPTANGVVRALGASEATPTTFRCDGRTHCSQMSSCEEAKFFLKNCPDTKMDGDGDGIPCESQWCN